MTEPAVIAFPAPRAPKKLSPYPRSSLVSRNVTIHNRRTSVRLEPEMWNALRDICRREHCSMHVVCTAIAMEKPMLTSLTAAIRVFIMAYYRAAATEDGHTRAGHGPGGHFMIAHYQSPTAKKTFEAKRMRDPSKTQMFR